ncbi:helix-turn-helix domain-containing protein [Clostridium sp. LIBA-8841]|uniref:helix-turn-helix domain-containing protein n=1 Tax=Clostridium sp. LIBA-8841 TaxID=2987530 RepID=UPI002AC6C60F|nr:helix-turn-helix domain-containing protein [Clostridium sp. LIBA-8841]MDZ5253294.1 helix-turn-helix domain-containing protein [Clostridium sp. LIBA-8841]
MNNFEKLYTIEDIAEMTRLTSRTIRNYLKDGILEGKKIGGQWRFTMKDIENFFDNNKTNQDINTAYNNEVIDFLEGKNIDLQKEVQICTIVDLHCKNILEGKELSKKLMTIINEDEEAVKNGAKFSYEYMKDSSKARFTLFGDPEFIIKTLKTLEK